MGFLFFVAVVGAVIFMANKSSKATLLQWQTAASNLNLAYYKGGFGTSGTISGQINGHRIAVSTITKGSGNSSSTYTRYRVEYRVRVPVDLKITRQGMLHGIGKAFGLQDIEVGDSRLDDLVIIHGANPDKVRDFLSPELRDTI
ncbi:MAG: hypothetical protein OES84_01500, partial [Kiritimatiellaceae bacterium]|nr:hypothetical protein [Kiritimatiellaceae bacterium]